MSMAREIYQQIIVDHGRNPRNFGVLDHPCCSRTGHNRLCGDILNLYVRVDAGVVAACKFDGSGCAISMASASLLTEVVLGQKVEFACDLFNDFHAALVDGKQFSSSSEAHERLAVFLGVAEYPARVKCATLVWQTLMAVLQENKTLENISTE
ncbi:MAG: SUF system NifU family Fe-S cluster assembly protein [Legionellales bacterium]|mgnify:CR=1 FL=1|jgi:nitrogen fixation protein NifU and related proteins|nr:SUF system NifU family Fe-S cluster assembly protein [Legionellales bacterium]